VTALLALCVSPQAYAQETGLKEAEERALSVRHDLDAISARLESITAAFYENDKQLQGAKRRGAEAAARYESARNNLNLQAAALVRSGGASIFESLLDDDAQRVAQRIEFVDVVINRQVNWVDETRQARATYEAVIREIQDRSTRNRQLLAQFRAERQALEARFRDARRDYLAAGGASAAGNLQAIAEIFGGKACPIEWPYSYTDDWGNARSGGRRHKGLDLMASRGATIFAYAAGTVIDVEHTDVGLAGRQVKIKHPQLGNVETWYFHLASVKARVGQEVEAGEVIGTNGSSGNAQVGGEHLHFEYHVGGAATPPKPHIDQVCPQNR
jgi:murein DD-endopeptidase MepM/ murein hydrolase activator NlpD